MKVDSLTIRSSIKQELYSKTLKRGSLLGALGTLPLLYGAIFMEPTGLSTWGIPLFFLGIGLIALGMMPIRRLDRLQQHPNSLVLINDDLLEFYQSGNKTLSIPCSLIGSLRFLDDGIQYGICVTLKEAAKEKVIVHDPRFSYERYQKESRNRFECDLFFPHFTRRSFEKIKHLSEPNRAS